MKSRNTIQKEIIQKNIDKINGFFTAEELFNLVSIENSNIGIATIYRFLKESKNDQKLYSYQCGGKQIYSAKNKSHCNFTCLETGKVFHFELKNLDFLKDVIPGEIESINIEVSGYCRDGMCGKHNHHK